MKGLENEIIKALKKGALSTGELADVVGENRSTVYNTCMRMKNKGILKSRLGKSDKKLLYCPLTKEVVTPENYEEIMAIIEDSDDEDAVLLTFYPDVRIWSLA